MHLIVQEDTPSATSHVTYQILLGEKNKTKKTLLLNYPFFTNNESKNRTAH